MRTIGRVHWSLALLTREAKVAAAAKDLNSTHEQGERLGNTEINPQLHHYLGGRGDEARADHCQDVLLRLGRRRQRSAQDAQGLPGNF